MKAALLPNQAVAIKPTQPSLDHLPASAIYSSHSAMTIALKCGSKVRAEKLTPSKQLWIRLTEEIGAFSAADASFANSLKSTSRHVN
jgi:hypothetical protein